VPELPVVPEPPEPPTPVVVVLVTPTGPKVSRVPSESPTKAPKKSKSPTKAPTSSPITKLQVVTDGGNNDSGGRPVDNSLPTPVTKEPTSSPNRNSFTENDFSIDD